MELLIVILIMSCISLFYYKRQKRKPPNLMERFRKDFQTKDLPIRRIKQSYLESLASDPQSNITINPWDEEKVLLEKANIHKVLNVLN